MRVSLKLQSKVTSWNKFSENCLCILYHKWKGYSFNGRNHFWAVLLFFKDSQNLKLNFNRVLMGEVCPMEFMLWYVADALGFEGGTSRDAAFTFFSNPILHLFQLPRHHQYKSSSFIVRYIKIDHYVQIKAWGALRAPTSSFTSSFVSWH